MSSAPSITNTAPHITEELMASRQNSEDVVGDWRRTVVTVGRWQSAASDTTATGGSADEDRALRDVRARGRREGASRGPCGSIGRGASASRPYTQWQVFERHGAHGLALSHLIGVRCTLMEPFFLLSVDLELALVSTTLGVSCLLRWFSSRFPAELPKLVDFGAKDARA